MSALHAYMSFAGEPSEGAVLVFAPTARSARQLAAGTLQGWMDCAFIDVRARRLREHTPFLMGLADPERLAAGTPHLLESPPTCRTCERWGQPIADNGQCARCLDERASDADAFLEV